MSVWILAQTNVLTSDDLLDLAEILRESEVLPDREREVGLCQVSDNQTQRALPATWRAAINSRVTVTRPELEGHTPMCTSYCSKRALKY